MLYTVSAGSCSSTAPPGNELTTLPPGHSTPFGSEATGSPQKNPFTDNPCGLDKNNPSDTWFKSQAPSYLDSLVARRGSGEDGSIGGLDQLVDKMVTGSQQSTMNCADITDTSHCPPPGKCEEASNKTCEIRCRLANLFWVLTSLKCGGYSSPSRTSSRISTRCCKSLSRPRL